MCDLPEGAWPRRAKGAARSNAGRVCLRQRGIYGIIRKEALCRVCATSGQGGIQIVREAFSEGGEPRAVLTLVFGEKRSIT
jgi:hypothetical protein